MSLRLRVPFPPSDNHIYTVSHNRKIKSKGYKDWEKRATVCLYEQGILPWTGGRCELWYELPYPDKRERDSGNYQKTITDLLVSYGILPDDNWKFVRGTHQVWTGLIGKDVNITITSAL